MKKIIILLCCVLVLSSCLTARSSRNQEPPRRVYTSVNTDGMTLKDAFVVDDTIALSSFTPSIESRYYSTVMFLMDLEILTDVTNEEFEILSNVLFTNFPADDSVKQVVIPSLSKYEITGSEEYATEKDAYIFISKQTSDSGEKYYMYETNIPINSYYGSKYDGYEIDIDGSFHKDKVPLRWTSVMYLYYDDKDISYSGVAYPNKAPVVASSENGPKFEKWASKMLGINKIAVIENILAYKVEPSKLSELEEVKNKQKISNMYIDLSVSAYYYLNGDIENSKIYYEKVNKYEVNFPDDGFSFRLQNLKKIMAYLLNSN